MQRYTIGTERTLCQSRQDVEREYGTHIKLSDVPSNIGARVPVVSTGVVAIVDKLPGSYEDLTGGTFVLGA